MQTLYISIHLYDNYQASHSIFILSHRLQIPIQNQW